MRNKMNQTVPSLRAKEKKKSKALSMKKKKSKNRSMKKRKFCRSAVIGSATMINLTKKVN